MRSSGSPLARRANFSVKEKDEASPVACRAGIAE
jgi:hypothetical protein